MCSMGLACVRNYLCLNLAHVHLGDSTIGMLTQVNLSSRASASAPCVFLSLCGEILFPCLRNPALLPPQLPQSPIQSSLRTSHLNPPIAPVFSLPRWPCYPEASQSKVIKSPDSRVRWSALASLPQHFRNVQPRQSP